MERIEQSRIIYLGETHTSEEDHRMQIKVLRAMRKQGHKFIILMEAFQITFQEHLSDYLNCLIDEEQMLELTEYKKRWRFKTELYSPIWRFAKENSIPLYALNLPSELLKEIRRKGLESVVSHLLPPKAVKPTEEYRKFLLRMLGEHKKEIKEKRFIDIQTAWDNGMAYRILKLMVAHPNSKLVVIVGKGHLYKGYGIPYVLSRWSDERQLIIYPSQEGDYLLFSIDFSKESSSESSIRLPN
jgi:uncharacterized iron-regulated protein